MDIPTLSLFLPIGLPITGGSLTQEELHYLADVVDMVGAQRFAEILDEQYGFGPPTDERPVGILAGSR